MVALLLWSGSVGAAAAEPPEPPLRIAVVGEMTGDGAASGHGSRIGVGSAIRDLGPSGVLGRPVHVEALDDNCDPDLAAAIAKRLEEDRPDLVIGHDCSGASLAAAPIYAAAGILQIMPNATDPHLTERGFSTLFRLIGRDDRQSAILADLVAKRWHAAHIAILDDGSRYGKGLADSVASALRSHGVIADLRLDFQQDALDYRPLAVRLAAARTEILFAAATNDLDIALLVREMRRSGLTTQVIGGDTLGYSEFWKVAGPSGDGVIFTAPPDARGNPAAADAVARLRAIGFEPEGKTLNAYAAVQVWAQAATEAGSVTAPTVAAALRAKPHQTVLGTITFDAKGDVTGSPSEFVLYRWHDGKAEPVR